MWTLIMAWVWSNKQLIVQILGGIVIAFFCWWFFWHNPKVIKKLETEKSDLARQVKIAHETINLLGTIERRHETITKISYRNISSIRYSPKPGRSGLFLPGGVLQIVNP